MSFTCEQFYNEAIRPNLARFSSTVKVRDILPHLPCLTLTDREEVNAKRETSGNFTAMQTLLDNLRRREKWPDEFITALRNCEHRELANEMSTTYDKIRNNTNNAAPAAPTPKPPPAPAASSTSSGSTTTTTTVTVHAVPANSPPLLIPTSGGAPVSSSAPSNIAAPAPVKPLTAVPAPSPEPVSQADVAPPVVAPSQAPSLPEASISKVSLPVPTLTGVAENKTSALDDSDGLALTDQTTISSAEALLSTSSAQASSSNTSPIQMTKPCTTSQSSQMSEKIQVPITVKDTDTSEKLPVQDTNPPLREERTVQEPEEISDPTANELVQRNNTVVLPVFNGQTNSTRTGQATSSTPTEEVTHPPSSIEHEYFSKPGTLQYPEPQQNRAEPLPAMPEEPCSVDSDDLEISRSIESSTEPGRSTSLAEQTSTAIASLDSASWCEPPHIAAPSTPNQPEEDHYESFCPSQTLVNEIRYAEEPPAENLNGQPPSMLQHSRVISENHIGTENVVPLSDPHGHDSEASDRKKSASTNYQEEESNARPATILQPELREEGYQELFRKNNYQLVAAAGIALSAVFLAWKLKH